MFKITLALSTLVCISSANAAPELPKDVKAFVIKREDCDHFRGELPEPQNKRELQRIIHEINKLCGGTDKKLGALKKKYANDPIVMERLAEFEEHIEERR